MAAGLTGPVRQFLLQVEAGADIEGEEGLLPKARVLCAAEGPGRGEGREPRGGEWARGMQVMAWQKHTDLQ